MAMPITISSRIVNQNENKFLVAFTNYALNDSGFMVECEYDPSFELPWAVRMMEIRDKGNFSLFGMMIKSMIVPDNLSTKTQMHKDAEQKFANIMSSEVSNLLNGFHGVSNDAPVPLKPESLIEELSEEVFTFGARDVNGEDSGFEIVPMRMKLSDLYKTPLTSSSFFKDLPSHILTPTDSIAVPVKA